MTRALWLSLLLASLTACQTARTVTLVGMSDYHAHAVPFTSEGEAGRGGVARAIAYLEEVKGRGDALVLSGGDTLNKGVPTWSDEYPCVEWPWFNGWVDAVVLFGHQSREDDEALAREVPGIDVILGTHSHYRGQLRLIPGTRTYYVSPYQYLAYLSEVRLHFRGRQLEQVTGGLVKMDASRPEDPEVAARVAELQRRLKEKRPERFEVLGRLPRALPDEGISAGQAPIGQWATEVLRRGAGAHAFFATSSTFRSGLPAGAVTVEDFYAAIPYRNVLALAEMTGAQLLEWLALVESRRGADGFSQFSGVRYTVKDGKPAQVEVLADPAHPEAGYTRLDPAATYRVGTLEFQAYTALGYRELFGKASNPRRTSLDMHTLLIEALKSGAAGPP